MAQTEISPDMDSATVHFTGPRVVEVLTETLPRLQAGQVLVQSLYSAISPGTEMLIYRNQVPAGMLLDENITGMQEPFSYPAKYGYSIVGRVIALGPNVPVEWHQRTVFAFHPHQSAFITTPDELIPLPVGITPEQATFLPNMETAVSFVMDGAPLIGERVAILGQGIVGLLTNFLLSRHLLGCLVTADRYPLRRRVSLQHGANTCLDPTVDDFLSQAQSWLPEGADLVYELSGSPAALGLALELAGYDSRVVIGSWYGNKSVSLDLGGRFHRSRIRLINSQVSRLAPGLSGRWTKSRRLDVAWEMLRLVDVAAFVTHRISVYQAAEAYALIDQHPEQTIQVLLAYD